MEAGEKIVTKLRCHMCTKHQHSIEERKNYSEKWVTGAESVRTTNVTDHAKSDQHVHAMSLHRKELAHQRGASVASYVPIACSRLYCS